MEMPANWKFTKDHEWVAFGANGTSTVGVTGYAIEQLGDIVHIDLPEIGTSFSSGDPFGTIESTKTVSDLYMPISGKVVDINRDLANKPENLHADSGDNGWLIKIELDDGADRSHLLSSSDYQTYIAEQSHD
jgi:glycine cleavage system H protein